MDTQLDLVKRNVGRHQGFGLDPGDRHHQIRGTIEMEYGQDGQEADVRCSRRRRRPLYPAPGGVVRGDGRSSVH